MSWEPSISRAEFVAQYVEGSGFKHVTLHSDGFSVEGYRHYALPCGCDYEGCQGWAMVRPDFLDHHWEFSAPEGVKREDWPPEDTP